MADRMQPTPRGYISGLFSDAVNLPLQYMSSPERTQQMQGMAQLLYGTGIPKTLERISYGDSLFSGAGGLGGTTRMRPETAEALMNVAPFAKPAAVMANRAAMTAGRAGARYAERVVPQVMERGGLPAQLLGDISRGSVSPLDVYHGTPYRFPPTERNPLGEFDASKIGTGEGAQAYGYGIYTAEAPTVAREYQQKLSSTGSAKNLASQYGGIDEGLAEAKRRVENYKQLIADGGGGAMNRVKSLLQISEKNVEDLQAMKAGLPENTGSLYKVDLPDEKIATMLDWDAPLIEQNQNVLNAAKKLGFAYTKPQKLSYEDKWALFDKDGSYDIKNPTFKTKKEAQDFLKNNKTLYPDITGGDLHDSISTKLNQFGGNDKKTAEVLNSYGVFGIKYFDEASKEAGQGTRNFVVFPNEEKSMTILERNGMPATPIESPTYSDPFGNTIGSSIR
jgi:hypothetical protein